MIIGKKIFLYAFAIQFIFTLLFSNSVQAKTDIDIIISPDADGFSSYQIHSTVYAISFLLNKFLLDMDGRATIKLEIHDSLKETKFEISKKENCLVIYSNNRLLKGKENLFRKEFVLFFLSYIYKVNPDYSGNNWIFAGCWSYVRKNLGKNPSEHEEFPFVRKIILNDGYLSSENVITLNANGADDLICDYYGELSEMLIFTLMELPEGKNIIEEYMSDTRRDSDKEYARFVLLLKKYGCRKEKFDELMNSKAKKLALINDFSLNERTREIDVYLEKVERKKILMGKRYNIYFSVLERNPELLKVIWPELNTFLDREYPMSL